MTIRAADASDAPQIAGIWAPVIRDTLFTFNSVVKTAPDIARLLAQKADLGLPFLVTGRRGAVQGFATYGQFRGGVGYARTMEHTIILGARARGQGAGRALMRAIEDHARAAGVHSLFAGISAANTGGVAFHAAIGYRQVATLREVGFKFDRWLDLVLMQKCL